MAKQLYSYYLMVLGGVRWNKKEFLESNLHVYDGDDTKIVVYSMGRWPKRRGSKKPRNLCNNTLNSYDFVYQQDIIT